MDILQIIGASMVLIGSLVLLIASIGLHRMPDAYNRIQVGTKASTMSVVFVMIGFIFILPSWFGKFFTIMLFVMLTNPISSNVLMRASHKKGEPLSSKTVIDNLKEDEEKEELNKNNENGTF